MPGLRTLGRSLLSLWRRGTGGRLVLLLLVLLWPFLVAAVAVAVVHDVVAAVDRGRRISSAGGWTIGIVAVLAVAMLNSGGAAAGAAAAPTASPRLAALPPTATPWARTPPPATPTPTTGPTPAITPTPSPTPVPGTLPIGAVERATVVRVVDGDTIVVDRGRGDERVRYIGIDTPETVDPNSPVEFMGAEASAANEALVGGRDVLLERDVSETDQYGRLLRYVWVEDARAPSGWLLVNLALVERGFAQIDTFPPDVRYADLYLAAQEAAREAALGLWGPEPTPAPTPEPKPDVVRPKPTPKPTKKPSSCHPSYSGVCLKQGIGDYDCAGGSGNGPNYVAGPFDVVGDDVFGLDSNHDGVGCENG